MNTGGTLNNVPCTRARFHVSDWGVWWADLELSEAVEMKGAAAIQLADIAASGTIIAGGIANGKATYRVAGGKGKWGKTLDRKPYIDDQGVSVAGVIADAAQDAGEVVSGLPAGRVGAHFARIEAPASRVLHALAPKSWRVDFDGVTRFGKRPTTTYTGDGARTVIDTAGRIVEIATESIAQLVPGIVVDGAAPASDVEYLLSEKRITVRVYSGGNGARVNNALAQLVESLFPDIRYRGSFEFRVVEQVGTGGERFHLQPVRVATGLSDLSFVPARGPAGVKATVKPGELVVVSFLDADPSRPFIHAHDEWGSTNGWMPLFVELGEEPRLGVARQTDPVQAGPFSGAIVLGSARVKAGV